MLNITSAKANHSNSSFSIFYALVGMTGQDEKTAFRVLFDSIGEMTVVGEDGVAVTITNTKGVLLDHWEGMHPATEVLAELEGASLLPVAKGTLVYDAILQGEEAILENALDYARGMVWCECETTEQDIKYKNHIDTIDGVGVWYDFGADYYFFTDETNS